MHRSLIAALTIAAVLVPASPALAGRKVGRTAHAAGRKVGRAHSAGRKVGRHVVMGRKVG
jgi:hypothetical protein